MSIKGLVRVKGSWGMGGGLLGVASFSLSWDSVSIPVAMFLTRAACRGSVVRSRRSLALPGASWTGLGSCLGLFLRSLGAAADQLICAGSPVSFEMDLVSNVGMRGQDVSTASPEPSRSAIKCRAEHHSLIGALCPTCGATVGIHSLGYN